MSYTDKINPSLLQKGSLVDNKTAKSDSSMFFDDILAKSLSFDVAKKDIRKDSYNVDQQRNSESISDRFDNKNTNDVNVELNSSDSEGALELNELDEENSFFEDVSESDENIIMTPYFSTISSLLSTNNSTNNSTDNCLDNDISEQTVSIEANGLNLEMPVIDEGIEEQKSFPTSVDLPGFSDITTDHEDVNNNTKANNFSNNLIVPEDIAHNSDLNPNVLDSHSANTVNDFIPTDTEPEAANLFSDQIPDINIQTNSSNTDVNRIKNAEIRLRSLRYQNNDSDNKDAVSNIETDLSSDQQTTSIDADVNIENSFEYQNQPESENEFLRKEIFDQQIVQSAENKVQEYGELELEIQKQNFSENSIIGDSDNLHGQIINNIDIQRLGTTQQLTMSLRPDEFGKLEIRLIKSSDGLIAQLISDTAMTRELLAQQANDLQQALRDKGFDIVQTEILSDFSDQTSQQGENAQSFEKQDNNFIKFNHRNGSLSQSGINSIDDKRIIQTNRLKQDQNGSVDYFA